MGWGRQPMPLDMAADLLFSRIKPVSSFSACWVWTGKPNENGYGIFGGGAYSRRGSSRKAHRRAYELAVGPIPDGLVIDHLCENRLCVNPLHLKPATQRENVLRATQAPSAQNARKTHCKNGHELSGENIRIRVKPSGRTVRQCRVCDLATKEATRRQQGAKPRW